MKKMKKILAMLLALTMVLGMGLTSMAANEDGIIGTSDDRGTITVSGIEAQADDSLTVTAYQIVKAKYENNGSFSGFGLVYSDVESPISLTPNANREIVISQENLNAILAVSNKDAGTTYPMSGEGGTYTATVPVGSYLVVVSGSEAKVYSPIVVSVNYENPTTGANVIRPGEVNVNNFTIANGKAWVKESNVPSFTKIEADAVENTNNDFSFGNSIDINNNVNYTLTIGSIPYYGGDYPLFNVVDTLDAGLTFQNDLVVKVDNTPTNLEDDDFTTLKKGSDYTLSVNDRSFTVGFVVDGEYKLNSYQSKTIIITYSAKLNNNAELNGTANKNIATLNFTYDSKVDGNNDSIPQKTYTYTFELTDKLLKTGENNVALGGATFVLYTDPDCTVPYINGLTNGTYITTLDNEETVDVNEAGKLEIKGLEAGTYYLKETVAPEGYSVNTHVYKIEIVAEYQTEADPTNTKDVGELKNWSIKVDDVEKNVLTIPNTKIVSLPSTGGIGTTIFTVAGCGIMIAAAFFFFASRKKEN